VSGPVEFASPPAATALSAAQHTVELHRQMKFCGISRLPAFTQISRFGRPSYMISASRKKT